MIKSKSFKVCLYIYLLILGIISIFILIYCLGRFTKDNNRINKYINNITVISDSDDLKLQKIGENNSDYELCFNNNIDLKDNIIHLSSNTFLCKNEKINKDEEDNYLIKFMFYIDSANDIYFDNKSVVLEYLNNELIESNNDIRIGIFQFFNSYIINTNLNNYEINTTDYINNYLINDFDNYKVVTLLNDYKEIENFYLSKDEEINNIDLKYENQEELVYLWVPKNKLLNNNDYTECNINLHNGLVIVKIWYEDIIVNDLHLDINLVFNSSNLLDFDFETINKLHNVYIHNSYLYLDNQKIDRDIFDILYSYDGINYSYYNQAHLNSNYNHVYVKLNTNNIYKESKNIILYYERISS